MAVKPKAPGETKIVAVMGDYWHNGMTQEISIRKIYSSKKDWRIVSVRAGRFLTPELLSDADLLITARYDGPDSMPWSPEGLVDNLDGEHDAFWTDEQVKAIVDNVRNRGMGFMALHCTLFCGKKDILNLMDIEPVMHNEVQPIWAHNLNQEHPITKGLPDFFINLDEQFGAVIKSQYTTALFETTAIHDKRHAVGGWCLENGKGRVVCLLPGHTAWPYRIPQYQEILWRAAHWATRKDIPEYPAAKEKGDYNFYGK